MSLSNPEGRKSSSRSKAAQYAALQGVSHSNEKEYASRYGAIALDTVVMEEDFLAFEKYDEQGHWLWKLLGLLANCALIAVFVYLFVQQGRHISPFQAVIDVYMVIMGISFILLEYKEALCSQQCTATLKAAVPIICRPRGRACCYIVMGLLVASLGGSIGLAVGLFNIITGFVIFILARQNAHRLDRLSSSYQDRSTGTLDIQQEFDV